MALEHLRLEDYSDRELLLILTEVSDGDGYASSADLAEHLGIASKYPNRTVANRLSWLQRWGVVEREAERDEHGVIRRFASGEIRHTQRWTLTEEGELLARGTLRKTDERALGGLRDDQLLLVANYLQRRSTASGAVGARLVDREWRRSVLLSRR